MKTWFTSDLHLFDDKTASRRGFINSAEHDYAVKWAWVNRIASEDEVFIMGDLSRSHNIAALNFISYLPGVKHLISGNHDGTHPMHNRAFKRQREYLRVFESVNQSATLKLSGKRVTLSHFPFTADHTDPPRYMQWRAQDEGQWLIHGHTHSRDRVTGPRQIHVGLDAWGMAPVSLKQVEEILNA